MLIETVPLLLLPSLGIYLTYSLLYELSDIEHDIQPTHKHISYRSIISLATFIASSNGSSTHLVTKPIFSASRPEMIRPVIVNSFATSILRSSRSVIDAPISGINPHLDSIIDNLQSGVEKRKSAPSATCRPISIIRDITREEVCIHFIATQKIDIYIVNLPPPKHMPCKHAITGTGSSLFEHNQDENEVILVS